MIDSSGTQTPANPNCDIHHHNITAIVRQSVRPTFCTLLATTHAHHRRTDPALGEIGGGPIRRSAVTIKISTPKFPGCRQQGESPAQQKRLEIEIGEQRLFSRTKPVNRPFERARSNQALTMIAITVIPSHHARARSISRRKHQCEMRLIFRAFLSFWLVAGCVTTQWPDYISSRRKVFFSFQLDCSITKVWRLHNRFSSNYAFLNV